MVHRWECLLATRVVFLPCLDSTPLSLVWATLSNHLYLVLI